MPKMYLTLSVCLSVLIFSTYAAAQDKQTKESSGFVIENGDLFFLDGDKREKITLPDEALAIEQVDQQFYVAIGNAGVAVLSFADDGTMSISRIIPVSHGRVTGFHKMDGVLWMQVDATTAVKLTKYTGDATITPMVTPVPKIATSTQPSPTKADTESTTPEPKTIKPIKIIAIYPGDVNLNVGSKDGVKAGDRFSVYRTEIKQHNGQDFTGEQLVAVITVKSVAQTVCVAQIWKGDRIRKDDRVAPSGAHDIQSLIYPRHLDNIGEISVVLRPLLAVTDTGGFGMLNEITASYWTKRMFFDVGAMPFGTAWTDDGNIVTTSILAHMGFNSHPFAVGLGAGVAITPTNMSNAFISDSYDSATTKNPDRKKEVSSWSRFTRARFALSQKVRLGAADGINFIINNMLLFVGRNEIKNNDDNYDDYDKEKSSGFVYGGTTGKMNIPIAARANIFIEGGGGVMGYAFGALGVFAWLHGNGDKGSIGLSASAGFSMIWGTRERTITTTYTQNGTTQVFKDNNEDSIMVGGPMISLGFNYRFGF